MLNYKFLILFLLTAVLAGCFTTPDTTTPIATQIAQLRSNVRKVDDRSLALKQENEEFALSLNEMHQENNQLLRTVKQNQILLQKKLDRVITSYKSEINDVRKNVASGNTKDVQTFNNTIDKFIDTVENDNKKLRQQVAADLTVLQKDFKKLQLQLNSYMTKTDALEHKIGQVAAMKASSSNNNVPKTPTTAKKKEPVTPMARTGVPSSSDIDYANVYSHKVVSGESLWKIARDYEVKIQDIINVNEDVDNTTLSIGQTIYVPSHKSK